MRKIHTPIHTLLLTAAFSLLPLTAQATPVVVPTSGWLVGSTSIAADADGKAPCLMTNQFSNGYVVRISGGGENIAGFAMNFRRALFSAGQNYDLEIEIEPGFKKKLKAEAYDNATIMLDAQGIDGFYDALRKAHTMTVTVAGESVKLLMLGAPDGLQRIEACHNPAAVPAPQQAALPEISPQKTAVHAAPLSAPPAIAHSTKDNAAASIPLTSRQEEKPQQGGGKGMGVPAAHPAMVAALGRDQVPPPPALKESAVKTAETIAVKAEEKGPVMGMRTAVDGVEVPQGTPYPRDMGRRRAGAVVPAEKLDNSRPEQLARSASVAEAYTDLVEDELRYQQQLSRNPSGEPVQSAALAPPVRGHAPAATAAPRTAARSGAAPDTKTRMATMFADKPEEATAAPRVSDAVPAEPAVEPVAQPRSRAERLRAHNAARAAVKEEANAAQADVTAAAQREVVYNPATDMAQLAPPVLQQAPRAPRAADALFPPAGQNDDEAEDQTAQAAVQWPRPLPLPARQISVPQAGQAAQKTIPANTAPQGTAAMAALSPAVEGGIQAAPERVELTREWRAQSGVSLREALESWSMAAHVRLLWQAGGDYALPASITAQGTYESAVLAVLKQFDKTASPPKGQIYVDPVTGQKVLLVR